MARDKASCANNVCCATDTAAVKARLEKEIRMMKMMRRMVMMMWMMMQLMMMSGYVKICQDMSLKQISVASCVTCGSRCDLLSQLRSDVGSSP